MTVEQFSAVGHDHGVVARAMTRLCGAVLVAACAAARPPVHTTRAVEEPPSRTLHAPRTSCQPPHQPTLAAGYRVVRWPTSPRFLSVGALGGALFATTTSSLCVSADGGLQWRPLLESLEYPTLLAMDHGAVVVREGIDPNGDAVPGAEVRWWVRDDGGERWRDQRAAPFSVGHGVTRVTLPRLGEREAVACGGVLFATVDRDGGPIVIESLDGGVGWRRARGVGALPREGVRVRCVASGFVMIERRDRMPVAFSRDAGASWRPVRPPPVIVPDEGDVVRMERGCVPLVPRGLFCELYGQTWVSNDDGRLWHRGSSPVGGRSLVERGAQLVGVGGGVAESNDSGMRWMLRASGAGRSNLGLRGGIVDDRNYWLAGSALWWTDDAGEHWSATLLSWELVAVIDRRRWVGFVAGPDGEGCRGKVVTTVDGGRRWRTTLSGVVSVRSIGRALHATPCGPMPRYRVGRDGVAWRPSTMDAAGEDPEQDTVVSTGAGDVVRLEDDTVRGGDAVLATDWPRDIVPVVGRSRDGVVNLVVFDNGTVLRRSQ